MKILWHPPTAIARKHNCKRHIFHKRDSLETGKKERAKTPDTKRRYSVRWGGSEDPQKC
jgi:hypothetical protein